MGIFKPNIEKMKAKGDVEGLIKALEHKDRRVREGAAFALERLGWKPGDDTEKVRYLIVKREWDDLAGLGGPAVQSLIQALRDEEDEEDEDRDVRIGPAEALRKIGEPAVESLIQTLKDWDDDVRYQAAELLRVIGDARAVEPMVQALYYESLLVMVKEDDGAWVPFGLVKVLSLIGEPAVEPLIQALKDKNPRIRLGATSVLGVIGDTRAVEPLTQALNDESEDVRKLAKEALEKIKSSKS
jgi:HEAT repeat protein